MDRATGETRMVQENGPILKQWSLRSGPTRRGQALTCTRQGPASPVDIDHAPPQFLVRFWRGFKHSDFHPIKVSVGHLHLRGRPCAFLPKRNDDEIERDQVVAQPQGVDQVTLQVAGRKRDAVNCGTRLTARGDTHQLHIWGWIFCFES